jgi:hypothetical protein
MIVVGCTQMPVTGLLGESIVLLYPWLPVYEMV